MFLLQTITEKNFYLLRDTVLKISPVQRLTFLRKLGSCQHSKQNTMTNNTDLFVCGG